MAADVDHPARRRVVRSIEQHADELIACAECHEKNERSDQPCESTHGGYDPSEWVTEANEAERGATRGLIKLSWDARRFDRLRVEMVAFPA